MGRSSDIRFLLIVFVLTAVGVGGVLYLTEHLSYAAAKGKLRATREILAETSDDHDGFRSRMLAEVVSPAVVSIYTSSSPSHALDSRALRDAFVLPEVSASSPSDRVVKDSSIGSAIGSGFIIDARRGYVLTNHHVVSAGDTIRVYLSDGRSTKASLIAVDAAHDIALLAIDLPRLHELSLGDSDGVAVGDDVLAFGNPFGLSGSVSKGIISAVGRARVRILGQEHAPLLQTDASMMPGSSGGPLVDRNGQVVGVSLAIAAEDGSNEGIGFAVPVNIVRDWLGQLASNRRAFLGVRVADAAHAGFDSKPFHWTQDYGAAVLEVLEGMAAEQAGLRSGDVIVALNGGKIHNRQALTDGLAQLSPGAEVTLTIWREQCFQTRAVIMGSDDDYPSRG